MTRSRGRTELLHNPESGICPEKINGNVMSYTGQLARYLKDASTIRIRVLDQFGAAPSIEDIRTIQERVRRENNAYRDACDELVSQPYDRMDFRVGSLVGRMKASRRPVRPLSPGGPVPTIPTEIVAAIAREFGLNPSELTLSSKRHDIRDACRTAAHVLKQRGNSYVAIGPWLGNRHRTSIMNLARRFASEASPEMRAIADGYIGSVQA